MWSLLVLVIGTQWWLVLESSEKPDQGIPIANYNSLPTGICKLKW